MSDKAFNINVVTPDGLVYNHRATLVVVEAIGGQLGIKANHEPIIASLQIAPVKIYRVDGDIQYIAVNGGFIEMDGNEATIVANSAERSNNIDLNRAKTAEDKAKEKIQQAKENDDKTALRRATFALQRAVNRIQVSDENK